MITVIQTSFQTVNERESRYQRPHRHVIGHFGDETYNDDLVINTKCNHWLCIILCHNVVSVQQQPCANILKTDNLLVTLSKIISKASWAYEIGFGNEYIVRMTNYRIGPHGTMLYNAMRCGLTR